MRAGVLLAQADVRRPAGQGSRRLHPSRADAPRQQAHHRLNGGGEGRVGGGGGRARGMLLEAVRDGERVEWSNKREILEFPQSTE